MRFLPTAITESWSTLVEYPYAIVSAVLFTIILNRLANRYGYYGLPRNVLFGIISGATAFVLFQLYVFLSRNYGLRSLVLAELLAGYETAVVVTVIWRIVFAQRPPRIVPPTEGSSD